MLCLKLKLDDPLTLVSTTDMLIEVIKFVPSMERFIREVDCLVWSNDRVLKDGVPHRLTTTLANLKRLFRTRAFADDASGGVSHSPNA